MLMNYFSGRSRVLSVFVAAVAFGLISSPGFAHDAKTAGLTPDQALARMTEGNARFVAGASQHPNISPARRAETAQGGQHPFATVLTCSDSRCPVERLFDQGVGDIFVIRVAGNVCATDEVGSIEYGVDHLQTPLLVVLGHTQCGAVTAVATGAELHGCIPPLVAPIKPALLAAAKKFPNLAGKELIPAAVEANVWQAIDDLFRHSRQTRERVGSGALKVLGAIYHVEDGHVQWLGPHPEQQRLLAYTGGVAADETDAAPASTTSDNALAAKPGAHHAGHGDAVAALTPSPGAQKALQRLKDGNARFVSETAVHPNLTAERLAETAGGQHPFATIIGCSDSRVPLELLFDQGVGDIFVIRVAGNVCSTDEVGSIEYGVGHLGTPLLVVLGHADCGAVTAVAGDAELDGSIPKLVAPIRPAVAAAKRIHPELEGKALVPAAVRANVFQSIEDLLKRSGEARELVRAGKLTILGAVYNIESGAVEWLGPHPQQLALLTGGESSAAETDALPSRAVQSADETRVEQRPALREEQTQVVDAASSAGRKTAGPQPKSKAANSHAEAAVAENSPADSTRQPDEETHTGATACVPGRPQTPPATAEAPQHGQRTGMAAYEPSNRSGFEWLAIAALILVAGAAAFFASQANVFKRMVLGTKIGVGFGALIAMAVVLGGTASLVMHRVQQKAGALAAANVPEVALANEVERDSLQTMYAVRGYAYTGAKEFLEKARACLQEVKQDLQDARSHAAEFQLAELKQSADVAEDDVLRYEKLLNDTVARVEDMAQKQQVMDTAARKYMDACHALRDDQLQKLATVADQHGRTISAADAGSEAKAAAGVQALDEPIDKAVLCDDLIALGNSIAVGRWKAQAMRDPNLCEHTLDRLAEVDQKLDQLEAVTEGDANLERIKECRAAGREYSAAMREFLANWKARDELNKTGDAIAVAVVDAARTTATDSMHVTADCSQQAAGALGSAARMMVVGLGLAGLAGAGLAALITRSITRPIKRIIASLTEGAEQFTEASGQVSTSALNVAEGASEQASSLEETSAALQEMTAVTSTNAETARRARANAEQARKAADEGDSTMRQLEGAMSAINDSSAQVNKIIKVIEEIAFQTNLLALNAAVEAARAGEHGKGFAVVAGEVRNLAQRCAVAARDTTTLIEGSVQRARQGADIAADVGKALGAVVAESSSVSELIDGIARASDEQAQGAERVNAAVARMNKLTQRSAAGAQESASAAQELSAQAGRVKGVVAELSGLVRRGQGRNESAGAAAPESPTA